MGRRVAGDGAALTGSLIRHTVEFAGHDLTLEHFTTVLAGALGSKDHETKEHSARLVGVADAVSRRLGLTDDLRRVIRFGAYLHDIGKVVIPEDLLRKRGPLTPYEFSIVRTHPEVGADILADVETWKDVRLIVRHHHEHFNGAGYPAGLRGLHIPFGARIVSAVDAYDVMRSGRPYQPPRPHAWILEELDRQRGHQFDPDVVDALLDVIPRHATAARDGGRGQVAEERSAIGRRRTDDAVASWARVTPAP